MRVLPPAVLVLLSLLAGCLENPPPEDPSPDVGLLPPTASPVPSPALPGRLLYERTHAFVDPRVEEVAVPSGVPTLHVQVGFHPASVPGVASVVSVALDAPNGTRMAECIDGTCSARVEEPEPGTWRVSYQGVAAREATVTLRIEGPAPVTPPTLPPTFSPPVPSPVPTPTPFPGQEWTAYERVYDYGPFRYAAFENDTFAVISGLDTLTFKVRFDGTGNATVRLVDPQGASRGLCRADGALCQVDVPAPAAGRWQVEYDGDVKPLRADVGAYGHSARPFELPSALPAFRQVHAYPEHNGNRTSSFWVAEGYAWVNLTFFFSRSVPTSPGDTPFVQVRAPDRAIVLTCRADASQACDLAAEAKPGLWSVWYLDTGTGAVRVDALLTERAATRSPPAPSPDAGPGERTLHRDLRHGRETAAFTVDADVAKLRILVEANRTMSGTVEIRGPGGGAVVTCAQPCHAAISAPQAGGWTIRYSPEVGEDVGATVHASSRP